MILWKRRLYLIAKRCYTFPMTKKLDKSTVELVDEVIQAVADSNEVKQDVQNVVNVFREEVADKSSVKEALFSSARFRVAVLIVLGDALLAALPMLVAHSDPQFVATVSNVVNHLMTLWSIVGLGFIGSRTVRNTAVTQ